MVKSTPGDIPAGVSRLVLETNGRRMHYLKAGKGPPVVLLHGGASDASDWIPTMAALENDFTFYAPDLPGFGRNERNAAGYYLDDFIGAIEEFIGALGLERPAVGGHSFGGRVATGVAVRERVNVKKLVLIDAAGFGRVTRAGSWLMTVFWALREVLHKPQPYPRFLVRDGEDTNWLCLDQLPALKTPVLIVWKSFDPYFPLSLARRAAKLIPAVKLEIFRGFGHAPNKQHNGAFNALLLDFLRKD